MMRRLLLASAAFGCAMFAAVSADANGYPPKGRAIDQLRPAADYTDVMAGRTRALGIMRARANGFVPSAALHDYVRSVQMKVLKGVNLPPSFQPDVRILAAPEFTALCTPDGTIIVTIGLLEQLDNEDELAFILGHETSHAIYRHHGHDWYTKAQYYAVMSGSSFDEISDHVGFNIGGISTTQVMRTAAHVAKLSQNLLAPQLDKDQEDAADALGFDLAVKAGYDSEASLAVMDKLAAQEAEAAAIAAKEKEEQKNEDEKETPEQNANDLLSGFGGTSSGFAGLGMSLFNSAVDNMAEDTTQHHPATERATLLSAYEFREYRTLMPANPTPLPWKGDNPDPKAREMASLLAHYSDAEDAAAYVAQAEAGQASGAPPTTQQSVTTSTQQPTTDHAYTEFVASEYYDLNKNEAQSEAALLKAVQGPEPSWEVYSRLLNIYMKRSDWQKAETLMEQAVPRFDNSPVLLPKRIAILHGLGRQQDAEALLPQCNGYDIKELYDLCKKAADGES
ncbi:MAG TPA: M48 family metallopeptidase [Rhizomicrobium sp.]|jgi:predicted Zn-dependent protease|nr:M48 family metallopeptidase [Rhizomicrobium sp.]